MLNSFFLSLAVFVVSVCCTYTLRDLRDLSKRWHYVDVLRSNGTFDAAIVGYDRLYEVLKHNPKFLLDYAKCFAFMHQQNEANKIIERALLICNNPTLYNTLGCNYQNIGNYSDAENCFKSSIHLLPGRIYPYYLLSKLYLESGYFDRNKAIEMASIVMTKHPKVYSKAIDEMRVEMKMILDSLIVK